MPAPYYLTQGESTPYCHTCGRIIGTRRANTSKAAATEVKYCSDRCKKNKPSNSPSSVERRAEEALTALLEGRDPPPVGDTKDGSAAETPQLPKPRSKPKKGDPRIIITVSEVETAVFGDRKDPEKVYGRNKNKKSRFIRDAGEWKSVDMEGSADSANPNPTERTTDDEDTAGSLTGDEDVADGGVVLNVRVRPPQIASDVNFSVGGERGWSEKIEETPEMLQKRREGQKRAEEKELIKSAVRRAVVFGLLVEAPTDVASSRKKGRKAATEDEGAQMAEKVRRKCEALMSGSVVEPSFAKGDWAVRWRED